MRLPRISPAGALAALGFGMTLIAREAIARENEADLRGQVVFITGGSRGLGLLMAKTFARQGCNVAICARDAEELSRARAILDAETPETSEIMAVPCDVTNQAQVQRVIKLVGQHFGRPIDILVNNAGIIEVGPLEDMSVATFKEAMDVIYWGAVYTTFAVLPEMRARRAGRIVTIASVGGKVGVPHLAPHCAAKFALTGFSETLRAEEAQHGITVTTIAPGILRDGAQLNAGFTGRQEREYQWFSLGASLPFASLDADEAARQIVQAVRRSEAERVLGAPAKALALAHGIFPQLTIDILALVNHYLLPKAGGAGQQSQRGMTIQDDMQDSPLTAITRLGLDAADRNNEKPGPLETLGG